MSVSIGASIQALSQVNSLRSSNAASGAGALNSILQMFGGATGQSSAAPPVPPQGANPVSPANAFDPSTFNALLSVQEKANDGVSQAANALNGSGAQGGSDEAEPTTETVTNPDGSTTTTLTYSDGTQEVTTTPPVQPVAATATDMTTDAISKNLDQLGDLLGPLATAAMFAL
jgi:hypothetical protein